MICSSSVTKKKKKLKRFIQLTNEAHPTTEFIAEYSRNSVTFLDNRVIIETNLKTVYTDLYRKDMDSHNYLYYSSTHPHPCKKSG